MDTREKIERDIQRKRNLQGTLTSRDDVWRVAGQIEGLKRALELMDGQD